MAIGSEPRQIEEEEAASEKESTEFSADWGDGESSEDALIEQTGSGEQAEDKKKETDDCHGSGRTPKCVGKCQQQEGCEFRHEVQVHGLDVSTAAH